MFGVEAVETLLEIGAALAHLLQHVVGQHVFEVADDGGADQRMTVPGAAAPPARRFKMLRYLLAGYDRANRQCRAVQPLAGGDQIRLDAGPMHITEPFAEAPHPADHFVIDPQKAVALGNIAQAGGVIAVRKSAAAAEHWLGNHGSDILAADGTDDLLGRFQ